VVCAKDHPDCSWACVMSNHGYQLEDKVWLMREHEIPKLLREPSAPFGCGYLAHGLLQGVMVNLRQNFIWIIYVEVIERRITWRKLDTTMRVCPLQALRRLQRPLLLVQLYRVLPGTKGIRYSPY